MYIAYYNNHRGIYSPLIDHNGSVAGFWLVGNNYRNKSTIDEDHPEWGFKIVDAVLIEAGEKPK